MSNPTPEANDTAFLNTMLKLVFDPEDVERWDGLSVIFPKNSDQAQVT